VSSSFIVITEDEKEDIDIILVGVAAPPTTPGVVKSGVLRKEGVLKVHFLESFADELSSFDCGGRENQMK
jgi:hypothetical protein